jgi:hypothetical protein
MYARIGACLMALAMALASPALAQERFGSLTGRVTDQQGLALPGLTVTITNTQSSEQRSLVTDADGRFTAPDLIPGRYRVRFELTGFSAVERNDILVLLGRTFQVDAQLTVGALTETVQVTGEIPLVDQRNTVIAHNVTAEEFDRMPKGRSFQSVALSAPSVNAGEIEGGFQVNGASGAENAFTVDGIVTNSLISGQSRQNTVFEYLDEVQVKTSGISAEFGGALGGVLSAVTKSGGNTLRGEAHYYFEGAALGAAPVRRLVLDPVNNTTVSYIQDREQANAQNEFGGSAGGPIVRDRLFFFGSYSPRSEKRTNEYTFTDGTSDIGRQIWRQQVFGKLTYSSGQRVTANWSALWTPTKATGTLSAYNGAAANSYVGTRSSLAPNIDRGYEVNQVNTSGAVNINLTNGSYVSLKGGQFHDRYSDTGIPLTTSYTYGQPTTPLNAIIPVALQGGVNTTNTPRALITEFDTTKRSTIGVDYNHVFNAGGYHTLKGGYGFQRTTNDINSYYPGGYVLINWNQAFTFGGSAPQRGVYGHYEVNDRRISNEAGNSIHSLYIQDQWTLGNRLTLNLGLRTENEKVPTFRPETLKYAFQFGFADKLAPRLGAAYDLKGDGSMKVFGSWGMYYDWTKYELARGSFGAETWCQHYRALDTLDIGSLNLQNMPGRDIWVNPGSCRDRRVPSFQGSIDPDIEPMRQSSTSLGYELQLNRNSLFSVHYIHNDLLETIEDVGFLTSTGDEGYLISNPGKRQAAVQFAYGATPSPQPVPRPKRQYDAVELGYNRRFADNYFFSANYTISRLYGNYAGLASSDEIRTPTTNTSSPSAQQQAGTISRAGGNVNRAWDIDEILWDSKGNLDPRGRLATDRPHVVKLYGSYDFPFGTQVGAFFYAGSGTPLTTYVTSTHGADIFVNGRGDMGRTPMLSNTNLLVSQQVRLAGTKALRFELNVLNIFNQKTTRHIYNYLNRGTGLLSTANLIDTSHEDLSRGYDYNALIRATPNGLNSLDPRYGMADLFEDGTRGFATVKFLF